MFWIPVIALLAIAAFVGTDRLGRPMTDEEKRHFGALLREHDYPGARLVALRFAYTLARGRAGAHDLMGRADLRLIRLGWDPREISLVKRLCRLVWSEATHAVGETDKARRAEEGFLRELEATEGLSAQSIEQRAVERHAHNEAHAHATRQIEKLREVFEKAGDEVNLFWLKCSLEAGADKVPSLGQMAAGSGRDVTEFYAAAKRRNRAVRRLLAEERGLNYEEDEDS
jgi:hypothetical protein